MNCFFYGCLHQINGTCPILKDIERLDGKPEMGNAR